MWTPISLNDLYDRILEAEKEFSGELSNFWELIKIFPEKWKEEKYAKEGDGFWVVAICGRKIVWYNDIEEGFNISDYKIYGQFEDYYCNQDDLNWCIISLFDLIKFGGGIIGQAGPPLPL
ncbi:hypothetical protein [Dysgonomonas sp. 520]|uniref:hypothetical protein n=1 Tax=Dysgonomonas sp. 520 TaxID=2302931 RepID=UPI0013D4095D|nr:hypothetical protein [Dysgonomonas sp. 520]NDW10507.1 hypothetical protein [Dysgonomonas sp. 520]